MMDTDPLSDFPNGIVRIVLAQSLALRTYIVTKKFTHISLIKQARQSFPK